MVFPVYHLIFARFPVQFSLSTIVIIGLQNNRETAIEQNQLPTSYPTQTNNMTIASPTNTSIPDPTQPPDLKNLYSFFLHPNIGSTRTYRYSVIPYSFEEGAAKKTEGISGEYTETVQIVNDVLYNKGVTIVGVETTAHEDKINRDIQSPCPNNFYWYIYDAYRLYTLCSNLQVYDAATEISSNSEPELVVQSQFVNEPLYLQPVYITPFEIGKHWQANEYGISVKDKITKTTSLGTFNDCFQIRFFQVQYEEFRYICPTVGLIAVEIISGGDYYSSELVSFK